MFVFINPWASYDPEDIPSLYSGDPKIDKRVMWAVIYSVVISIIYLLGSLFLMNDLLFEYIHHNMLLWALVYFSCFGSCIGLLVFGINKIMK